MPTTDTVIEDVCRTAEGTMLDDIDTVVYTFEVSNILCTVLECYVTLLPYESLSSKKEAVKQNIKNLNDFLDCYFLFLLPIGGSSADYCLSHIYRAIYHRYYIAELQHTDEMYANIEQAIDNTATYPGEIKKRLLELLKRFS